MYQATIIALRRVEINSLATHFKETSFSNFRPLIGNESEDEVIRCQKDGLLSQKWHQKTEHDNQRRTTPHTI